MQLFWLKTMVYQFYQDNNFTEISDLSYPVSFLGMGFIAQAEPTKKQITNTHHTGHRRKLRDLYFYACYLFLCVILLCVLIHIRIQKAKRKGLISSLRNTFRKSSLSNIGAREKNLKALDFHSVQNQVLKSFKHLKCEFIYGVGWVSCG